MPYPQATDDHVAFFEEHGWIAVENATAWSNAVSSSLAETMTTPARSSRGQ